MLHGSLPHSKLVQALYGSFTSSWMFPFLLLFGISVLCLIVRPKALNIGSKFQNHLILFTPFFAGAYCNMASISSCPVKRRSVVFYI